MEFIKNTNEKNRNHSFTWNYHFKKNKIFQKEYNNDSFQKNNKKRANSYFKKIDKKILELLKKGKECKIIIPSYSLKK